MRLFRADEDLTVNECGDGVRSADARLQVRGVYCAYTPLPRPLDRWRCSICTKMRFFLWGPRGTFATFFIWGLAVYLLDGGVATTLENS